MSVTNDLDQFIKENGNSARDALNVALARLSLARAELTAHCETDTAELLKCAQALMSVEWMNDRDTNFSDQCDYCNGAPHLGGHKADCPWLAYYAALEKAKGGSQQ